MLQSSSSLSTSSSSSSPSPSPLHLPSLSSRQFRWGLIGSGRIAADFTRALACVPGAIVHAVGARSIESAQQLAKELNIPHAYGSYEELVKDPLVDIIYIATVHSHHYEQALLAIKYKKHLLVEKAFTQNAKQAQEVIQAAKSAGVFLMEAQKTRFMPWCVKLREILSSDLIGEVRHVICDMAVKFSSDNLRIFDPNTAGGSLLDVGIYPLSIVNMIYGSPHTLPYRVDAIGQLLSSGVDGSVAITLQYSPNQFAQLYSSAEVNGPKQLHILGTEGRVVMNDWSGSTKLTLITNNKSNPLQTTTQEFNFTLLHSQSGLSSGRLLMAYEGQEVHRCILARENESPDMKLGETLALMRLMDEIRRQIGLIYPNEKTDLTDST